MKRLVLTFLSMATVCAVVSASPAAAQETVTGAPAGTVPVTVEGTGTLLDTPAHLPLIAARPTHSRHPSDATLFVTLITLREGTRPFAVPDLLAGSPTRAAPFAAARCWGSRINTSRSVPRYIKYFGDAVLKPQGETRRGVRKDFLFWIA
jgi:hypothetical protein